LSHTRDGAISISGTASYEEGVLAFHRKKLSEEAKKKKEKTITIIKTRRKRRAGRDQFCRELLILGGGYHQNIEQFCALDHERKNVYNAVKICNH
jgi:hypothetical protein